MDRELQEKLTRRRFAAGTLQAVLLSSLFHQSARADALAGTLKWSVRPWLRRLEEASAALSSGGLAPRAWQQEVEDTLGQVHMPDFLRSLDYERLAVGARFPSAGEGMQRLYFLEEGGRLQALAFRPFLFTLRRGAAVVPHGHHNMATMHLVLGGRARVRHFDRLESTATHMLIRPASDVEGGPGVVTSISDEHENIHWFEALSDRVLMFNIGVYQVRPGPYGERDYVDPLGGVAVGGGVLRAARLARVDAYAKYGHA
ncbi:MAG: hypothetical protein K0S48_3426 [Ramlibacter sp.]|jgi:hypothetical protein|nr:hypothetical protein [Ramlibacter sp.]